MTRRCRCALHPCVWPLISCRCAMCLGRRSPKPLLVTGSIPRAQVRTTIEGKLMAPDLLVEVDAIAVRKDACA